MTADAPERKGVRAVIFDLDGTLADTEALKARAYGDVIRDVTGRDDVEERALRIYVRLTGATDRLTAATMVDELGLADALAPDVSRLGVSEPWEALHALRMARYLECYGRAEEIARNAFRHNVELARAQRASGRLVAVATSSPTGEARRVISALGLDETVREVVGRDQVQNHKPHPEIYLVTAGRIGVSPAEVLVVEDSLVGVRAALAAGMACVAVANAFTASSLRVQSVLAQQWIAYSPDDVSRVVARRIAAVARGEAA